ncbi:MAG: serine/threonine protein kinase [Pseudomonadota bacterium]
MASGDEQGFGKYKLLDRLATGGMAEIYRARYTAAAGVTKEMVIKKILPAFADNRRFVQMFIDEARISVGLSHGNIAQVFDFGEIDGEYFLAMEFVDGQPLSRALKRLRERGIAFLPSTFAAYIALQVCRGLHYAHTRLDSEGKPLNIIHRDVSPQNVLLAYEGQVKLVDFGIAKARMAGRDETQTGAVKGKYLYFAPEQARGRDLDARADVYAVGVLLYEMACGRLPFEGKMIEVLGKIVKGDFKRPRELNPALTPAFERLILTAMATDRGERYPTAQALAEALSGYLYANAPTFGPEQVVRLLGWIYQEELRADGRAPKLPREFLEQVASWQTHPEAASRPAPAGVTRAAVSGELSDPTTDGNPAPVGHSRRPPPPVPVETGDDVPTTGEGVDAAPKQAAAPRPTRPMVRAAGTPRRWPWIALPLGAAGLAAAAVFGWSRWDETPPPAVVVAERPLPAPPAPPRPALPPLDVDVRAWSSGPFRLVASRHAFGLAPTRAARIRLDPSRRYRVWVDPAEASAPRVLVHAEGAKQGVRACPEQATEPWILTGATALFAWVHGEPTDLRAAPARMVRIQPEDEGAATPLRVDPSQHALAPSSLPGIQVNGLDPLARYALSADAASPLPQLLALASGPRGLETLIPEPGRPLAISGASGLRLILPGTASGAGAEGWDVQIAPKN